MLKRLISGITASAFTLSLATVAIPATVFATAPTVTHITDCDGLQAMGDGLSGSYVLDNNIDCSASDFEPVGAFMFMPFTGSFDGHGHTISGLHINSNGAGVGLFGGTNGATISNVGILGADITGDDYVGALVGFAVNTDISNAYSSGSVTANGPYDVGGLIGVDLGGTQTGLSSSAQVSGYNDVGGLAGAITNTTLSN